MAANRPLIRIGPTACGAFFHVIPSFQNGKIGGRWKEKRSFTLLYSFILDYKDVFPKD